MVIVEGSGAFVVSWWAVSGHDVWEEMQYTVWYSGV